MPDLETLKIEKMVVHKVGNKMKSDNFQVSENEDDLSDTTLKSLLEKYFLSSFNLGSYYKFIHESDLFLNEIYNYIQKIYIDQSNFYEESINILKHLYNKSVHPNIKAGEFYLVYFKDHSTSDERTDAIGIFKSENKETYLKVDKGNSNFDVKYDKGVNINKLDKGCLIFNENSTAGYRIAIVDSSAKAGGEVARYWKNEFLNVAPIEDKGFLTKEFINICDRFVKNAYGENLMKDQGDNIEFRNAAHRYLEDNTEFKTEDFVENIFHDEKSKDEFIGFKKKIEEEKGMLPIENFVVASNVVTKLKKVFSTSIKLDTGSELKISSTEYLEQGYDEERNMKYYKIFFHEEL
ncbi:nucleoid-associated protein [Listeria booriae]|uniref:nucleoid-associated protein n=1 Tax=Listeria booriae TaxID=1552123 RepID=UPI0016269FCA|nr:nucleoid-associated protein [Listeria booriae]MBC1290848.1 nucleoid-associated protein [Listeria booriae]MBC2035435.1 nucleoid-associated protein [Listeria booriae]